MTPTADTAPRAAAAEPWQRAVRRSHDRLAAQVRALEPADLRRHSYDPEWSVAQVLSHLGSQAEIFSIAVDAGLGAGEPPSPQAFPAIWDAWDTRTPESQAADSINANEALVSRLEAMGPAELDAFALSMFGMDLDAAGLMRMRLSEHAVHSWDVVVTFDPAAQVADDAVDLLVDGLPEMAARVGKPGASPDVPGTVALSTTGPSRQFLLVTSGVRLEPGSAEHGAPSILLPAEALLRLVYGRLDGSHPGQGPVEADGASIEELRPLFPGF